MENFHIGAGSLTVNGQDIGHTTTEGIEVNYEPDVHLHMSGKYGNTPVKASLIGHTLTLTVTMAESTLANMKRAMGGSELVGDRLQIGGVAGTEIPGVPLVLTPFDGTPAWHFASVVPTGEVTVAYKVEDERVLEVEFTALVDEDEEEAENLAYLS